MAELDHVMLRTGRIVAADQNLTVEVRGDAAYATRGRVVVPSIECYSHLGDDAERMLHGLLDHECGHASDTDFGAFEQAAKRGPAFKHLVNAVEDGYIEARKGTEWRGCAQNLARKNEWFWTRAAEGEKTVPQRIAAAEDLWAAFLLALTMVLRPFGGRRVSDMRALNEDVHTMLVLCEDEIAEVRTLTGIRRATARTVEISERIYAKFEQLAEQAKQEADDHPGGDGPGTPGEPGDEKPDGPGQEPAGGSPGAKGDEDEGEDGDDAGGAPGDAEGDEDGSGGAGDEEDDDEGGDTVPPSFAQLDLQRWSDTEGEPLNPEQAIQVEVRSVFEQPDDVRPYIVFDPSFDLHRDFASEDHAELARSYEKYEVEAAAATEALTMAFEAGLRAKRECRPVFGADEGFVDPVILPEYATGSVSPDRMYLQYAAEDDARGVAVSILVDCSGSMGNGKGSKSHLARLAAIAMHQALRQVQVPHEVCGFTTCADHHVERHRFCASPDGTFARHAAAQFRGLRRALVEAEKHGTDIRKFARSVRGSGAAEHASLYAPIHATFKRFDQQEGLGLCHVSGNSQNLDGEAVIWQARRLAQRPERRRVLFVLSDGHPAGSRDNAQGARYLSEAVARVMEAGIEVYGLGIMSKAVEQFYPLSWVVSDVHDLARVAVDAMTDVIVRNRSERECVTL